MRPRGGIRSNLGIHVSAFLMFFVTTPPAHPCRCAALLEQVSAATRLRRSHIALGASGLVTVMVFLGFGASLLW